MNFIKTLAIRVINVLRKRKLAIFIILFLIFSLTTCTPAKPSKTHFNVTEEERRWLKEFFRELLFENPGAYTLYGTKPISGACWYNFTDGQKNELQAYYDSLPSSEKEKLRTKNLSLKENFQKWQKIKERFSISQYLFGIFPSPYDENAEFLLFVNVEMTLRTLINYYSDFRRVLDYDFDPITVTFDVENKNSPFWKAVLNSHVLKGILFGYGRDNAWFFDWSMKYDGKEGKIAAFVKAMPSLTYENQDITYDANIHHFPLPIFGSYGMYPSDTALFKQYRQEYKKIKNLYKKQDEVDLALEWLTRSS